MKKRVILTMMAFTVLVLLFPGFAHGAIPASEREVLIALYNSTDGDNWYDNSGWKTPPLHTDGFAMPGTEGNWYGIYLLGDHVDTVYFHRNHLSGSLPYQLGNLSHLRGLSLAEHYLSGSIPSQLGNLSNLEALYLVDNQLSGSIPSELGNLSHLRVLSLDHNQLSGSIPSQLGNLSNLEDIDLTANHLSGSIPSQLGNLSKLKNLVLPSNRLSGDIPYQLGNLSNLSWLYLSSNFLSGSIPSQLGNLSNLEALDLGHNRLSGSIPSELGNLSNLEYFNLHNNQLSGSIPSRLGNLSKLKWLYLYSNQLSGSIPSELGNLSTLYWLILDHNQLSGVIPSSFMNLIQLYKLDIGYNCLSANDPAIRAWLDNNDPDWEAHQDQCGSPGINLSRTNLYFGSDGQSSTSVQSVLVSNNGSGTLNWSANANVSWLSLNPSSGIGDSVLEVSIDPTGLAAGTYPGTIAITAPSASNSPQSISVQLQVYKPGTTTVPFGDFATPVEGSSTFSSIPVTGWALDDVGVASVKIYNGNLYIGDAVFVEGARPDVQAAYPTFPNNYKAGWGYMLLTNFLPGGGNGQYTLIAKAMDIEGKEVTLGAKTITIDNAHAVKPFGAIDTPTQGGTASGNTFINWGWVLTPQPNEIPTNGSTINVYVDGVYLGHPIYNIDRPDIALFFPGYANSSGAAGYFYLDTTALENGVHTIQWTATDTGGNCDGIGSRYFTIQNPGSARGQSIDEGTAPSADIFDTIPTPLSEPIEFNKGFSADGEGEELLPDEKGKSLIIIKELEPVEIQFGENYADIQGYMMNQNELHQLPIGSTLDVKSGTFSWSPGPGFIGQYSLVFVLTDSNGQSFKKSIEIKIEPKFNGIQ